MTTQGLNRIIDFNIAHYSIKAIDHLCRNNADSTSPVNTEFDQRACTVFQLHVVDLSWWRVTPNTGMVDKTKSYIVRLNGLQVDGGHGGLTCGWEGRGLRINPLLRVNMCRLTAKQEWDFKTGTWFLQGGLFKEDFENYEESNFTWGF